MQPVILETNDAKSERNKKEAMLLTEDKAQGAIKSWSEDLLNKFPLLEVTTHNGVYEAFYQQLPKGSSRWATHQIRGCRSRGDMGPNHAGDKRHDVNLKTG